MTRKDLDSIIKNYLNGTATSEELRYLENFEQFAEHKVKHTIFNTEKDKNELRKALFKSIHTNIQKKSTNYIWLKIAATIVILVSMGMGLNHYYSNTSATVKTASIVYKTKETSWGQKASITLPDGSVVRLNSGSKITFPEKFSDTLRAVTLEGEAFFDVVKDKNKPFIITSNNLTTTVLGTTFNVEAYQDETNIKVTLATGKVAIDAEGKNALLIPSEQMVFNKKNKHISTQKVDVHKYLEWKDGVLRFENENLGDAVKKLEKWYNVTIVFENKNLSNCTFTGIFKNERLQTILEHIVFVKKNVAYKFISEREILLKGNCTN